MMKYLELDSLDALPLLMLPAAPDSPTFIDLRQTPQTPNDWGLRMSPNRLRSGKGP